MPKTYNLDNYVKPYDIGNTIVAASVSEEGKIVSLNRGHDKHGYIKLTPVVSFSNSNWYNPEAVRNYRNSFLSKKTAEEGYGIEFEFVKIKQVKIIKPVEFLGFTNVLHSEVNYENIKLKKFIFVPPNKNFFIQVYELENISNSQQNSKFKISGKYGIIRASYGQITENGPIEIPPVKNIYNKISENSFSITETGTSSSVVASIIGDYSNLSVEEKSIHSNKPLTPSCCGNIKLESNKKVTIALIVSISDEENYIQQHISLSETYELLNNTQQYWNELSVITGNSKWNYIVNRNFAYSYGCCCLKKYGAMITDHQSLPLTWNRDNYFMFKLMEYIYKNTEKKEIIKFILSHINWLFTHITESGWGRSHLITGRIKDKVFQFDQQCYPIIELYDFLNICNNCDSISTQLKKLDDISDLLLSVKGSSVMLFETEENPADDPVLYPYHFSTQVLAWKTFEILNILNIQYNFSKKDYAGIAEGIQKDIFKYMIVENDGKKLFCYTTDLRGNFELYHDANDLPLGLAPLWGFINADDEIFQNTVNWAFSPENRGYYDGKFGGLGSDHAKGHWPLGDSQLLAIALSMIKCNQQNGERLWEKTLDMLESTAQKDGLFSESVHPNTGQVYTRYWFAWPGATISWLYLSNKYN